MSANETYRVGRLQGLKPRHKLALLGLAYHANEKGISRVANAELGRWADYQNVARLKRSLQAESLVVITEHGNGRGQWTRYIIAAGLSSEDLQARLVTAGLSEADAKRVTSETVAKQKGDISTALPAQKGDGIVSPFCSLKGDISDQTVTELGHPSEKGDIPKRVTSETERVTSEARKGDRAVSPDSIDSVYSEKTKDSTGEPSESPHDPTVVQEVQAESLEPVDPKVEALAMLYNQTDYRGDDPGKRAITVRFAETQLAYVEAFSVEDINGFRLWWQGFKNADGSQRYNNPEKEKLAAQISKWRGKGCPSPQEQAARDSPGRYPAPIGSNGNQSRPNRHPSGRSDFWGGRIPEPEECGTGKYGPRPVRDDIDAEL